jgi:hypothetical protein
MKVTQQSNEFQMPTAPSDSGWKSGPLPTAELEHVAWLLFRELYPLINFDNALMQDERNHSRKLALTLQAKFRQMDRWTIENAHEKCAAELQAVMFGDHRLGPSIRRELLDYCETFIADAWGHFRQRLFYPSQVEANQREIDAEKVNRG